MMVYRDAVARGRRSGSATSCLSNRAPDVDTYHCRGIKRRVRRGQRHGMVLAHGVTTIFYLLEKARGTSFAGEGVERQTGVFAVVPG